MDDATKATEAATETTATEVMDSREVERPLNASKYANRRPRPIYPKRKKYFQPHEYYLRSGIERYLPLEKSPLGRYHFCADDLVDDHDDDQTEEDEATRQAERVGGRDGSTTVDKMDLRRDADDHDNDSDVYDDDWYFDELRRGIKSEDKNDGDGNGNGQQEEEEEELPLLRRHEESQAGGREAAERNREGAPSPPSPPPPSSSSSPPAMAVAAEAAMKQKDHHAQITREEGTTGRSSRQAPGLSLASGKRARRNSSPSVDTVRPSPPPPSYSDPLSPATNNNNNNDDEVWWDADPEEKEALAAAVSTVFGGHGGIGYEAHLDPSLLPASSPEPAAPSLHESKKHDDHDDGSDAGKETTGGGLVPTSSHKKRRNDDCDGAADSYKKNAGRLPHRPFSILSPRLGSSSSSSSRASGDNITQPSSLFEDSGVMY